MEVNLNEESESTSNSFRLESGELIPPKKDEISSGNYEAADSNVVENIDEALSEMGGFGNYQFKFSILLGISKIIGSFALSMGFYELQPDY